jgi:hypothetical protein
VRDLSPMHHGWFMDLAHFRPLTAHGAHGFDRRRRHLLLPHKFKSKWTVDRGPWIVGQGSRIAWPSAPSLPPSPQDSRWARAEPLPLAEPAVYSVVPVCVRQLVHEGGWIEAQPWPPLA